MRVERIGDASDPRVEAYREVRDADVRGRHGLFIAEGRFVVRTLLTASPMRPRSVFVTPTALESIRDVLEPLGDDTPVYVGEQEVMNGVVGFDIHRGCLAAGERGEGLSVGEAVEAAACRPIVALESVNNHDNIGGVFRNAAAFGAGAVLLSPGCADPLYRKAIRVSMGCALRVPFAEAGAWPDDLALLRARGYAIAALTTAPDAREIGEAAAALRGRPVAVLLGAEGPGLTRRALEAADVHVRIAMAPGVDSLNVVVAGAIALHRLGEVECADERG